MTKLLASSTLSMQIYPLLQLIITGKVRQHQMNNKQQVLHYIGVHTKFKLSILIIAYAMQYATHYTIKSFTPEVIFTFICPFVSFSAVSYDLWEYKNKQYQTLPLPYSNLYS